MRPSTSTFLAVAVGWVSASVSGCGLASASAGRVGCSPDEITIVEDSGFFHWGNRTWVAVCHGRRHHCTGTGSENTFEAYCTPEDAGTSGGEGPRQAPSGPPPQASEPRRAEIAGTFRLATRAVLACFPGASLLELDVLVSPEGNIYNFRASRPLAPDQSRCLRQVFAQGHAPRGLSAVLVRLRFQDERTDMSPAEATAPLGPSPPADDSLPLRTSLDGQRDAILACAERTNVVVIARWDATGTVSVALSGDLAGTPAEGCVRSAVGTQHVTAGAPGEVRHLVR